MEKPANRLEPVGIGAQVTFARARLVSQQAQDSFPSNQFPTHRNNWSVRIDGGLLVEEVGCSFDRVED